MRYICICCGSGAADEHGPNSNVGRFTYDCHVCKKHGTLWPHAQAKKFTDTVLAFQQPRGGDHADRICIGQLQSDINVLKAVIARQQYQLKEAVEIVDEVLPQAGHISLDWGKVNEFLCAARTKP